jgi:hypothetical protein
MRNPITVLMLIVIMFASSAAQADIPACLKNTMESQQPYGTGALHRLWFHVYDAEFWSDGEGWDASAPYALHLTYFVEIEAKDFLDSTIEQLERQPEMTGALLQRYREVLAGIYPDVEKQDSITALYQPDADAIQFCHNGQPVGRITDSELIRPFFAIWLGKHTSEPALRRKLLQQRGE